MCISHSSDALVHRWGFDKPIKTGALRHCLNLLYRSCSVTVRFTANYSVERRKDCPTSSCSALLAPSGYDTPRSARNHHEQECGPGFTRCRIFCSEGTFYAPIFSPVSFLMSLLQVVVSLFFSCFLLLLIDVCLFYGFRSFSDPNDGIPSFYVCTICNSDHFQQVLPVS